MAGLAEQVVSFPLVGGIDESAAPRLCSRMLTMHNCRQFKNGSIGKRYGTTCIGTANARLGGGTPPAPELLAAYGSELVRIGAGQVDSCRVVASTDAVYKGRASEALIYRRTVSSGESSISGTDVAHVGGLTIYVLASFAGDLVYSRTDSIAYMIFDESGVVVPYTVLVTTDGITDALGDAHVAALGSTFAVTWTQTSVGLRGCSISAATLAVGAITTLVADPGMGPVDTTAAGANLAAVYATTGGDVCVATWDATLAPAVAPVTIFVGITTDAVAARCDSASTLYVAWSYRATGTMHVITQGLVPATLATAFASTTVQSVVTSDIVRNIGIGLGASGTSAWILWTRLPTGSDQTRSHWTSVTNAGSFGAVRQTYAMHAASDPFLADGRVYALVTNYHSTHATHYLVHLQDGSTPATTLGMRIVAVSAPRQVPRLATLRPQVSSVVAWTSTDGEAIRSISGVVSGSAADSVAAAVFDIKLAGIRPMAVQAGGVLVCSGGVVTAYDGASVAELGMAYEPDAGAATATPTGSGGLSDGEYRYLLVYEWLCANGAIVRSVPSYPFAFRTTYPDGTDVPIADQGLLTATATAGDGVDIEVRNLNLTNKQAYGTVSRPVAIVVYRTEADGATFYRASGIQINGDSLNHVDGDTVTIRDEVSDATLRTRPALYTTGGVLPSEIPPSASHVAVIENRVWLSGTDDDTIWVSHEIVQGEAPTFSGSVTIAPFDGGRVIGISQLNEKKLVLKSESIHVITGTGPAITGLSGSFSTPESLNTDLGCVDARSIVSTPVGVFFMSQNGLALVAPNLAVSLVGKAVEDTIAERGIVASHVVPDQELVRLAIEGTATTVECDMFHGGAWGSNAYQSPGGSGTETICGAAYARGAWHYINSAGLLFKETRASWLDTNGASSSWVTMRARTRYISLGDLQGYARIWYASVVGDRKSSHDLAVKLYVDEEASTTQTASYVSSAVDAWQRYQAQVHVYQQECEALSVEVSDASPSGDGASVGTGQGFVFFGVAAEVGLEKPLRRVPAAQTR